jgi:hypothetical protein
MYVCYSFKMKTSLRFWRAFGVLLVLLLPWAASAQVVINEILASNEASYNNDGDFPDFIEIYNGNTFLVDIGGWKLTDIKTNTFVFRPGTTIPAQGFLVVNCDDNTNSPGLHTKFSLSAQQDKVTLWNANNVPKDEVRFGFQITDRSIGRVPDLTGGFSANRVTPGRANVPVPQGARNKLRINEWMPLRGRSATDVDPDWFEIYNSDTNAVSLAGVFLCDDATTNPPLPALSFIAAGGFIKFTADSEPQDGIDHVNFKLSSTSGDQIRILNPAGALIHRVSFTSSSVTLNVSQGWLPDGNTNNLMYFTEGRDTPGESNFLPIDNVFINEALAHTDLPFEDAIELYNPTAAEVDISGWWLTNSKDDYSKFRIPTPTKIPPFGYKVFYEWAGQPGGFNPNGTGTGRSFTLNSAHGDQVYLFTATATGAGALTGYRRGIDFPANENGFSWGRYVTSTGETDFIPLRRQTFGTTVTREDPESYISIFRTGTGATNARPKLGPLVISEIMYHPPDIISGTNRIDNDLDEFVEIYNASTNRVYLYDTNSYSYYPRAWTNTWRINGDIDFQFPTNLIMQPGESIVLVNFGPQTNSFQSNVFNIKYKLPHGTRLFGPYGSKLGNGGGSVEIERPDAPQDPALHPDDPYFVPYLRVDKVTYKDKNPWPTEADGGGYSIVRKVPEEYGNDPINWRSDRTPTPGRQPLFWLDPIQISGSSVIIRFEGLAGSSYSVLASTDLLNWTNIQTIPAQTTTGPRQATISSGSPSFRFFRIATP